MAEHNNRALPTEVDLFDDYFRRADSDKDGRIGAIEAFNFLQGSNLPTTILKEIVTLVYNVEKGFLEREDFIDALKLVTLAQQCHERGEEICFDVPYAKAAWLGGGSAYSPPKNIPPPHINTLSPDQPLAIWSGLEISTKPSPTGLESRTRTLVFPNGNRYTYMTAGFCSDPPPAYNTNEPHFKKMLPH